MYMLHRWQRALTRLSGALGELFDEKKKQSSKISCKGPSKYNNNMISQWTHVFFWFYAHSFMSHFNYR
jgi:hypothetical protein